MKNLKKEFRLDLHKAFQFARNFPYLFDRFRETEERTVLLSTGEDLSRWQPEFIKNLPKRPSIAILPKATNTIPGFSKARVV